MKKGILLIFVIFIISLSSVYAGWFDNKISCDNFEMENIEGFGETEGSNWDGHNLGLSSGALDPKSEYRHLWIVDDGSIEEYNLTLIKNITDGNFIAYMTDENSTLAQITIDNVTYTAHLSHEYRETSLFYDERAFQEDAELLKKYMSTITAKK